jgi:hypothetical protein
MARVEPRVMSFEDLIDQIGRGVLRVPRFQRSFVWTKAQILQLFKSIRHRYPIGTLLNWSTDKRYTSFDRLGPIQLPPEPVAPAEVSYVLDGHQRVSAIFGALALTDAQAEAMKGKDRIFVVYYDLAEEAFIHKHPRQLEPHHLPVRYLLSKEDRLTTWLDERRDEAKADTPEREAWNLYRRRAGLLQATFAKYQLPYLHVTDADIAEAVQIFRLLNSQGTRVKKLDVFAALTWRPGGFDFSAEANRLIESYPPTPTSVRTRYCAQSCRAWVRASTRRTGAESSRNTGRGCQTHSSRSARPSVEPPDFSRRKSGPPRGGWCPTPFSSSS